MSVAQSRFTHVGQLDVAFGARVHEEIAVYGMELCCGDDLGQFLHVDRLYIDDV